MAVRSKVFKVDKVGYDAGNFTYTDITDDVVKQAQTRANDANFPAQAAGKEGVGGEQYKKISMDMDNGAKKYIDGLKITDGKVGGKIPVNEFQRIRESSTIHSEKPILTLGRYTPTIENGIEDWSRPGPDSYIVLAGEDSSFFNLGDNWKIIQNTYNLSDAEMFEYFNRPALYDAVSSGKTIRFSHDPRSYDIGFLVDEWEYIKELLRLTDNNLKRIGDFWYVQ